MSTTEALPLTRRAWLRGLAGGALAVAVLAPLGTLLGLQRRAAAAARRRPRVGETFPLRLGRPAASGQTVWVFASAGCDHCERTLATLGKLAGEPDLRVSPRVVVTGIAAPGRGFYRSLPAIVDDGTITRRYGVVRVPTAFVIDPTSRVEAVVSGDRHPAVWRALLTRSRSDG